MRIADALIVLLLLAAPPAAGEWRLLGAADSVASDEGRWAVLLARVEYRPYDARENRFEAAGTLCPGCFLAVLGHGRRLVRCSC